MENRKLHRNIEEEKINKRLIKEDLGNQFDALADTTSEDHGEAPVTYAAAIRELKAKDKQFKEITKRQETPKLDPKPRNPRMVIGAKKMHLDESLFEEYRKDKHSLKEDDLNKEPELLGYMVEFVEGFHNAPDWILSKERIESWLSTNDILAREDNESIGYDKAYIDVIYRVGKDIIAVHVIRKDLGDGTKDNDKITEEEMDYVQRTLKKYLETGDKGYGHIRLLKESLHSLKENVEFNSIYPIVKDWLENIIGNEDIENLSQDISIALDKEVSKDYDKIYSIIKRKTVPFIQGIMGWDEMEGIVDDIYKEIND